MKRPFPYRRVLIVGCGGAGKSTLASDMEKRFGLPVINLDKLWWLPDWVTRSEREFDELLARELEKPEWIIEGNFDRTFATRLTRADFCIFLDYDTELCIKSIRKRVERYKGKTRPDMTEGCPERADAEFENWVRGYNETVKPRMLEKLKASAAPYAVFATREQTAAWLDGFSAE